MEPRRKLYAAKTVPWPGATPFFPPVCGPNPLRGFGGHARPWRFRSASSFVVLPRTRIQGPDSNRTRASYHCRRPLQTMRHLSYFAKEISDTQGTCSTRCTRTGRPKVCPQPRSTPSSTPVRSNQRWHSRPISCLSPTTFWTTFLSGRTGAEVELYVETLFPP